MKNNLLLTILIGLLTFGLGYLISYSICGDNDHHDDNHVTSGMHSSDAKYEVSSTDAPTVSLTVEEDAVSGWNIHLTTTNFTFAPQNVNGENVLGEGHAHLYVDGEKVARLYGNYFHYPESFDGEKTFRVTLNANDHSEYAVDGVTIMSQQTISHSH